MKILKKKIGTVENKNIYSIEFINKNNFSIIFFNLGGYIHRVSIPYINNSLNTEDVILGYKDLKGCKISSGYFNCIVGRVSNRISNASFILNKKKYTLYKNIPRHHLHGGKEGFNKKIWKIEEINKKNNSLECVMTYKSKNLEENYPGNLNCKAIYSFNNKNEFEIRFEATSDKDTIINLTNHNYWNFHGHKKYYQNILNHKININSDYICEINKDSIPTGKLLHIKNTKFDFNNSRNILKKLLNEGGIDHNYVLRKKNSNKPNATVFSNITGMGVEYYTNQKGMQIYTGNMMEEKYHGKYRKSYGKNFGICFEPQIFPDAINHPNFPSPILRKGSKYKSKIVMRLRNDFIKF